MSEPTSKADALIAAFKVGEKSHKRRGVTPLLREVMDLYRENNKPKDDRHE